MPYFHLLSLHLCTYICITPKDYTILTDLVEWVGAGAPPGEEQGEADGLEDTGKSTDGYGVEWALLSEDLSDELDHH